MHVPGSRPQHALCLSRSSHTPRKSFEHDLEASHNILLDTKKGPKKHDLTPRLHLSRTPLSPVGYAEKAPGLVSNRYQISSSCIISTRLSLPLVKPSSSRSKTRPPLLSAPASGHPRSRLSRNKTQYIRCREKSVGGDAQGCSRIASALANINR